MPCSRGLPEMYVSSVKEVPSRRARGSPRLKSTARGWHPALYGENFACARPLSGRRGRSVARWDCAVMLEDEREQRLQVIQWRGKLRDGLVGDSRARGVVADDHDLTRAGLRFVLAQDTRMELVGEARDGREAVALATTLQPDLVLMDLRMPGMDGLQATRALREACPMTSVLILSMFEDADLLLEAIKAGAAGYVLK